jgi:hypothetical protein
MKRTLICFVVGTLVGIALVAANALFSRKRSITLDDLEDVEVRIKLLEDDLKAAVARLETNGKSK